MSFSTSNTKQTRLDFSVGKRTTSNNGKALKTTSKPTEAPQGIPSPKTNIVEQDEHSFDDIILVTSESDDDSEHSEAVVVDNNVRAPKPTEKKVPVPSAVRTTRASAKKGAQTKTTAKFRENDSADIANPGVFRASNSRSETTTPKAKTQATTESSVESKDALPELKLKDSKWKKYYAEVKNKTGNMPPIHAETQNKIHEILRIFDTSYEYGPCVGVSRLDRWNRAKALGLNPPKEVEDILKTKQGVTMPEYSQTVFFGEV